MDKYGCIIRDRDYNEIWKELRSLEKEKGINYAIAFERRRPEPTPPYYIVTTIDVFPEAESLSQEKYNEIRATIFVTKEYDIKGDVRMFGVDDLPEPVTK